MSSVGRVGRRQGPRRCLAASHSRRVPTTGWSPPGTACARSRRLWRRVPIRDDRDAADGRFRRLCQRRVDRTGARQPGRQGHRYPAAQDRPRRSFEGGGRISRFLRLPLADLAPKGDYPVLQKGLAAWRDKRSKVRLHSPARGRRAQARHDRSARAGVAPAPGRTRSGGSRSRARRGSRALRRAAGRRGQGLPGDQGAHGRRRDRRQDDAIAQHHDRRAHRADRRQSRAPALAAGEARQPLCAGQCRRLFDDLRRPGQASPSRAW